MTTITPRDALEVVRLLAGGCGDLDHAHTSGMVPEAIAVLTNLVERAGEPVAWIAGYMQGANDHADCALDQVELRDDAMRGWEHEATQRATAPGASHER